MSSPVFSRNEAADLLHCARRHVETSSRGQACECEIPADLAAIPVCGIFVTLRNGDELRACIGNWHGITAAPLGPSLTNSARSVALSDHRFAPILAAELPELTLELSILHTTEVVETSGDGRIAAVEVGRHGLLLEDRRHRGLLLPQVAAEKDWDAPTFLVHTARKAGLHDTAWRDPAVALTTFEAVILTDIPAS